MNDEDIQIEISGIKDYKTYKTFKLIGMNQVYRQNIRKIRGTCVRNIEKKLFFIVKNDNALNGLDNFCGLMMYMQDDVNEVEIEFDMYSPENYSDEVMVSSNIMETLYLLEESGVLEYDVDRQNISINIKGMEHITSKSYNALSILRNINDNPELSNIFARVGPPQDLSDKIHTDDDARKAAKTFSEGRKSLEDLLYFCFTNNIKTFASCAGHGENAVEYDGGYISFNLDDEFTRNFMKHLNQKTSICANHISIDETYDLTLTEDIHCHYGNEDHVFTEILEILEQYIAKKDASSELDENNKLNEQIDAMLSQKNSPTNTKCGFSDTINGNIKLSLVEKATHFIKQQFAKIFHDKEHEEIKE